MYATPAWTEAIVGPLDVPIPSVPVDVPIMASSLVSGLEHGADVVDPGLVASVVEL